MSDQCRYSIITVDPSDVDLGPNAPFRFRRHLPGERGESGADRQLAESVREHGILRPPLFTKETGSPRESMMLVQGFRRCAAARHAGLGRINALLLTYEEDRFDAAVLRWLADIDSGEPPSELETIICTKKIADLGAEALRAAVSKARGKQPSAEHVRNLRRILELDDPVLEALHRADVSTGDLLTLMEHPFVDINDAVRILAGERLTRSDRRKAVHLMLRIGDCGGEAWKEFARSYQSGSGPLPDALSRAVHPTLTRDLERIERIIRDMHLPPGVSMAPPENMDGDGYRLHMPIRDERALDQTCAILRDALHGGMVSELLKILRGEH